MTPDDILRAEKFFSDWIKNMAGSEALCIATYAEQERSAALDAATELCRRRRARNQELHLGNEAFECAMLEDEIRKLKKDGTQ